MTQRAKKIVKFHLKNEHLEKKIVSRGNNLQIIHELVNKTQTMWEMDNSLTISLSNDQNVFDYYNRLNCDQHLQNIKIPCLFINSYDDPVCKPEFIPIDKLNLNPNFITILTSKGGHG